MHDLFGWLNIYPIIQVLIAYNLWKKTNYSLILAPLFLMKMYLKLSGSVRVTIPCKVLPAELWLKLWYATSSLLYINYPCIIRVRPPYIFLIFVPSNFCIFKIFSEFQTFKHCQIIPECQTCNNDHNLGFFGTKARALRCYHCLPNQNLTGCILNGLIIRKMPLQKAQTFSPE